MQAGIGLSKEWWRQKVTLSCNHLWQPLMGFFKTKDVQSWFAIICMRVVTLNCFGGLPSTNQR